jgi:hypothetical protein
VPLDAPAVAVDDDPQNAKKLHDDRVVAKFRQKVE